MECGANRSISYRCTGISPRDYLFLEPCIANIENLSPARSVGSVAVYPEKKFHPHDGLWCQIWSFYVKSCHYD